MNSIVSRRTVLGAPASGALALVGCKTDAGLAPPSALIDCHTHLFNASDLSIANFVGMTVFNNYTEPNAVQHCPGLAKKFGEGLGRWLRNALHKITPSAADELAWLRGESDSSQSYLFQSGPQADAQALERYKRALARELGNVRMRAGNDPGNYDANDPDGGLLEEITDETGLAHSTTDMTQFDDDDPDARDREQVERLLVDTLPGIVGRYVRWAYLLSRPRKRIIEEYKSVYGRGVPLRHFVALMVDYEEWLDERPKPGSDIEEQIEVMHALQQNLHPELLSFAPFDPLAQVFVERNLTRRPRRAPLAILEEAFASGKIQGAKLYPPMGFRPIDNASVDQQQYQQQILDRWNARTPCPSGANAAECVASDTLGAALDRVLTRFYNWAAQNDVPILAHSGNSVSAGCKFAERGSPRQWEKVLSNQVIDGFQGLGKDKLRLSLGHFDDPEGFSGDHAVSWGWAKARLLRFENVYGDISYMEEILGNSGAARRLTRRFFETMDAYLREFPYVEDKFVFGSDWIMLAQEPRAEEYLARMRTGLAQAHFSAEALEKFSYRNAMAYLKLT